MPKVVSIQPEVTEKWMDRFVVDLVECPSVSRTSAAARAFGPAVSYEYSPVLFAVLFPGWCRVLSYIRLSQIERKYLSCQLPVVSSRPFFWGRSPLVQLAWALAHRVSEWIRRKLCQSEQTSEPCWLVLPRERPRRSW